MLVVFLSTLLAEKIDFSNLKNKMLNSKSIDIFMDDYIGKDSGVRFFTYQNIIDLFKEIESQFSFSRVHSIGKSFEDRDIPLLTLGENYKKFEEGDSKDNPPAILLTSAHHAREVVGVSMNIYVALELLYNWVHDNPGTHTLLENHVLYFLPMVNVDGYYLISEGWEKSHFFNYIRKNRRNDGGCVGTSIGVDLNRNYDFKWGLDNDGSSPNKCQGDYRGEMPFSEPETQAVRDFITSSQHNVKIAINFHTWGNLFIIPFNFDNESNKDMIHKPIYAIYEDIRDQGNLPEGMLFGNGKQTIKYKANGDATDWMATQNDLLAISPELGILNTASNRFFPNLEFVKPIIKENYPWVNYTIHKLSAQIDIKILSYEKEVCMIENCTTRPQKIQKFHVNIQAQNLGFSVTKNISIKILADSDIKILLKDDQQDRFVRSNELTYPSLASLESTVWNLRVEVPMTKWKELSSASVNKPNENAFLSFENYKYPLFASSEKSIKALTIASLVDAKETAPEDQAKTSIYYYVIIVFIILVSVAILVAYCFIKNKKPSRMIHLDGKRHQELEMGYPRDAPGSKEDRSIYSS
ncbi:unnamed protein product [Moneuplotes crassus]|uniref:Peptidase M14 domain-containing protein n=1 Tax=Euplotes crassus TaxID=5936 RepID=A0AAD1UAP4_EUPCR|nr:unnamed protein product [Moneuplotes crassus]